jgi:hypothetical protein
MTMTQFSVQNGESPKLLRTFWASIVRRFIVDWRSIVAAAEEL